MEIVSKVRVIDKAAGVRAVRRYAQPMISPADATWIRFV
jgi:hypothetical protein